MPRNWIAALAALVSTLFAAAAFAAVDANRATQGELESIKGIGPTMSTLILDERRKRDFRDWPDFIARVKGVGPATATRYSRGGLTVAGKSYPGATPAAQKQPSAAAKAASDVKEGGRRVGHGFGELGRSVGRNAREETSALKQSLRERRPASSAR